MPSSADDRLSIKLRNQRQLTATEEAGASNVVDFGSEVALEFRKGTVFGGGSSRRTRIDSNWTVVCELSAWSCAIVGSRKAVSAAEKRPA